MKLSIVIPVYRTESTLDRCMESVLGQSFADLEVILVDDGSPDRCPQMCDEWARRDRRVRVVHKPNGGLSDARNAGIDVATGELITFVDSDDFVGRNTYQQVVPLTQQADIVEYAIYWQYGSHRQEMRTFPDMLYDNMQDYWLRGKAYEHTYACNKVFRRNLFSHVRFPKGVVFEDAATLPLLLEEARTVVTTHLGCYYYQANEQGITAKASGKELAMLLDSHAKTMTKWVDDVYYMHVLNIQLDVCELTNAKPLLPHRHINACQKGLNTRMRIKAFLLNLFGIKGLCRLVKTAHLLVRHHS